MFRALAVVGVVLMGCGGSGSAWRGHSSFFASETEGGPPIDREPLETVIWSVDLTNKRLTVGDGAPRTLSDDGAKRLTDALFALTPVTHPNGCVADASVRTIDADELRYVESQNHCTAGGSDAVLVGSLRPVFDELYALSQ